MSAYDGTSAKYYEPDALGSTDALADQSQAVADRWSYRAFGAATQTTGTDATPFTWVGRLGYFSDGDTGLYLLGSGTRHYDRGINQFLSDDPLGFWPDNSNMRGYVTNNPICYIDPTGLITERTCQVVADLIKTSPWYRELAKQGCEPSGIICEKAPDDAAPGEKGRFVPETKKVYLYYQAIDGLAALLRTLIHELVHAYDYCRGINKRSTPYLVVSACTELRAYFYSGDCLFHGDRGGVREKTESVTACLLRQATESIQESYRKYGKKTIQPEAYVCCAWKACECQRQTPGRGRFLFPCPLWPPFPSRPKACDKYLGSCVDIQTAEQEEALRKWCDER